jgi:hypothetical protein
MRVSNKLLVLTLGKTVPLQCEIEALVSWTPLLSMNPGMYLGACLEKFEVQTVEQIP